MLRLAGASEVMHRVPRSCRRPLGRPLGRLLAAAIWLSIGPCAAPAGERDASFALALESIRGEQLKGHVDYLADDALEGREPGTEGGREAGRYLAEKLQQIGLGGAGVDAGFFQPFDPNYRNVLGLLRGGDAKLGTRYVVVGAHYDHLGYGTRRNSRGQVGRIHNGADDNASGTSAVLEVAEAFTLLPQPPRRSILFALWDAEEKGLLGSKHWIAHPTLPLDRVDVLLNVDMVGRLRDDRMMVYGSRTGYGWRRLLSQANQEAELRLEFPWGLKGNGDHWPFFDRNVPGLMLHTGLHDHYHCPTDDAHLINVEGMTRAARLLLAIAYDVANADAVPPFRAAARQEASSQRRPQPEGPSQKPTRLGVEWRAERASEEGIRLARVAAGSPAERAGLQPGDRIVEVAGRAIHTSDDLSWAVASADNPVRIRVRRAGRDRPLDLTGRLDGRALRLGILWRTEDAEPGALVITDVIRGSPAAEAELQPGDYVYQIAGRDFADEARFIELVEALPGPVTLLVERDGRLRTVEIPVDPHPRKRAA